MTSSTDDNVHSEVSVRRGARLNPTISALMRRGLSTDEAEALKNQGFTLASLKSMSADELAAVGIPLERIAAIRAGGRSPIPAANLAKVLWSNRFCCCSCRRQGLAIIVHHITPWAKSKSHDLGNLAVLCLEDHARAHRKGDLEQNLTAKGIVSAKQAWEAEVQALDANAILNASRLRDHHWLWFNHIRLFEFAENSGIRLAKQPAFSAAHAVGMVGKDGHLSQSNLDASYRYEGGNGNTLYRYVRSTAEAVLKESALFNVSDDLDPGFLAKVVSRGDFILVQGKHYFKKLNNRTQGPGQSSEVRREANGVRISFAIDRWDAVANSAWNGWLTGTKRLASILRVVDVEHDGRKLRLRCTGIAIGTALEGLTTRSYVSGSPLPDEHIDVEENWLDGFGEDE